MALFHTLRDDFATDQLATLWPDSFGGVSVTGGRCRVTCDTGFSAAQSDNVYELTGSKALVQVFPPAAGGGSNVIAEMFIVSGTGGTDAGFSLSVDTGVLSFLDRVGFSDPSPVTVTYSSTDHRWWRIQRTGGNLVWSTSSDGDTWTTRRTSTAPAWSAGTTLAVNLLCHRDSGTNDFGEFDNFNNATILGGLVAGDGSTDPALLGTRIATGVLTAGSGSTAATITGTQRTVFGQLTAPQSAAPTIVGQSSAVSYPPPARQASWRILTGPAPGGYELELTEAQDRRMTFRLKDPSDLSFNINGRHPQAAVLDELATDAHVLYTDTDGETWQLFRGRLGTTGDTLTEDSHRVTATFLDYRGVLARRRLYTGTALNNNWSFEHGLTSWTGSGGTLEAADDQHQDGAKSGKITPDGVSGTVAITSDNIAVTAGTVYRVSGWMRTVTTRDVTFGVTWKNGGGGTISSSTVTFSLDAETWERVDEDAAAPAGAVNAVIFCSITGTPPATDFLWLDDARLTTTPQHASKLAWTDTDQADIAWGLVADTQARLGGDLGIVNAATATGVLRTRVFQAGDSVAEKIDEIADTDQGFDWDIVPISPSALQFVIWHEERGTNRGVVLDYGGLITQLRREVQPAAYANAIRQTGDASTTPSEREADDIASVAQGRFDAVFGDSGLKPQPAVEDRAHWQMKASQVVRPSYQVTLKRGSWRGPGHIWLGDPIRLIVYSGRLQVDSTLRVHEISIGIDGDGGETVQLSLNPPPTDPRIMPSITDRRLTNLERR